MHDLTVFGKPLLHFQRLDMELSSRALQGALTPPIFKELAAAFARDGDDGLVHSLRQAANTTEANMNRLSVIASAVSSLWFGKDPHGRQMVDGHGRMVESPWRPHSAAPF